MIIKSLGEARRLLLNPEIFLEIRLIKEERRQRLVNIHSHPVNNQAWLRKIVPEYHCSCFFWGAIQNLSDNHEMRIEVLMEDLWSNQDPILVGFTIFWFEEVDGERKTKHVTLPIQNA